MSGALCNPVTEEQGLTTGVAHKGNNLYSIGVLFGIGEQPGAVAPWEQVGPKGCGGRTASDAGASVQGGSVDIAARNGRMS